ncbi:MAG: GNAT family N-acetyltransferase [Chloroflexota bacterium]
MVFEYEIRSGAIADLPYLAAVERGADAIYPPNILPQNSFTVPIDILKRALLHQTLVVAGSLEDDEIVGFAAATPKSKFLHLNQISVLPAYGRRGIGRKLVTEIVQIAQEKKLSGVTLNTFAHIPWNAPFYQSLGFQALTEADFEDRPELDYLKRNLERERAFGLEKRVAMLYPSHS